MSYLPVAIVAVAVYAVGVTSATFVILFKCRAKRFDPA
jgi:hypothetical protein